MNHLERLRWLPVAVIRLAAHSLNAAAKAAGCGWGGLCAAAPAPEPAVGAGKERAPARRRRRACLGCQTWLNCRRCRYCCCRENAKPSRARWAAAARAATGTRFLGAAAAAMARLADYFIVVGYDHEKPGKGVERAPPPGLPAPAPGCCPVGSAGPGVAARRRGGPGRPPQSGWSASGLLGQAEPRGGREGPARGQGEGRRPRPSGHRAARLGASQGAATVALEGP